jgi:tetratricopeptide (TPR) repeat protein
MAATSLAVAGRPLTEHELATVANIRPAELAAAVAALERSDFVRRTGPAVGFVHERYAPAAEALLTEPERRATHLRFARLLARTETTHPASGYEAARHFAAAGRRGSALAHAQQAARYAGSIGAERGRADALELAWGVQSAPDAELAVDLGVCQLALGEWDRLAALAAESEARCAFTAGQRAAFAYLGIAARSLAGRATQEETREALSALLTGAPPFAQRNEAVLLLMRTADKTGHYGEVKRLARELRRAETCVTAELSEYALFAAGYVFCKYYWPRKALPLLELALHKAQKGNNWRLAQASREACGVALKMVGKFRESVEQFEISLALARKTMNPQAEALTLQNRAVSEMALGIESVAMDTFREAAKVGDQGWALRLFSPYNQALIWFSQGDYLRAKRTFETTVESATRARVLFLQADCYAGIGLCCQRVGDRDGLREATARLNAVEPEGTSPRLGWIDKAANAWNRALNEREGDAAVARLALECERLARRDVAYWLSLECEKVFLAEAVTNARDPSGRNRLASLAKRYEARGVERLLATS